jgi:predicted acetyltransferase
MIRLDKVLLEEKELLFRLLQFALYDGSLYNTNKIGEDGLFPYKWFDNYFTDDDRDAFFIREDDKIVGFVMINQFMKKCDNGHSVAEFLVLPEYRRNHIGKKVAYLVFDMFPGNWEVEPIEESNEACRFWENVVVNYTNNKFSFSDGIYVFKNHS